MSNHIIPYFTRDGKGNDFVKEVEIKQFPQTEIEFDCPICKKRASRGIRTKAHGCVFYSKSMGGVTVCNPILWFRLEDVAAALSEYNAPIHPIYKKNPIESYQNRLKEDSFIRLGYITSKDLLNKGTAVFLRVNYPDKFNELSKIYPEIRLWV